MRLPGGAFEYQGGRRALSSVHRGCSHKELLAALDRVMACPHRSGSFEADLVRSPRMPCCSAGWGPHTGSHTRRARSLQPAAIPGRPKLQGVLCCCPLPSQMPHAGHSPDPVPGSSLAQLLVPATGADSRPAQGPQLRFQLPNERNMYVDLVDEEDVQLMFDEWADYTASPNYVSSAKLQVGRRRAAPLCALLRARAAARTRR